MKDSTKILIVVMLLLVGVVTYLRLTKAETIPAPGISPRPAASAS